MAMKDKEYYAQVEELLRDIAADLSINRGEINLEKLNLVAAETLRRRRWAEQTIDIHVNSAEQNPQAMNPPLSADADSYGRVMRRILDRGREQY